MDVCRKLVYIYVCVRVCTVYNLQITNTKCHLCNTINLFIKSTKGLQFLIIFLLISQQLEFNRKCKYILSKHAHIDTYAHMYGREETVIYLKMRRQLPQRVASQLIVFVMNQAAAKIYAFTILHQHTYMYVNECVCACNLKLIINCVIDKSRAKPKHKAPTKATSNGRRKSFLKRNYTIDQFLLQCCR